MPNEQIIDFMASKYDTYNNNPLYFIDGYHLSVDGQEFFSSELVKAINESN
jgi:lysophospholipase L1-like esterase